MALLYLIAIGVIERFISTNPLAGAIFCSGLLFHILLYVTYTWERPGHKPLLCLTLVPILRLVSITLPLYHFPIIYWYLIISLSLLIAAGWVIQRLGYSWQEVGLNLHSVSFQLIVGLSGLIIGSVQYAVLSSELVVFQPLGAPIFISAVILLFVTGFVEELCFRGVIQRAMTQAMGRMGELYVAALYSILNLGDHSSPNLFFVFGVSLFFGRVVAGTRSILGVSLAHGLANIVLFLILPTYGGA